MEECSPSACGLERRLTLLFLNSFTTQQHMGLRRGAGEEIAL